MKRKIYWMLTAGLLSSSFDSSFAKTTPAQKPNNTFKFDVVSSFPKSTANKTFGTEHSITDMIAMSEDQIVDQTPKVAANSCIPSGPIAWLNEHLHPRQALTDYITCLGQPQYTSTDAVGLGASSLTQTFSNLTAINFNAASLYPGSVVQGNQAAVAAGHLDPVTPAAGPGTIILTGATFKDGSTKVYLHLAENKPEDAHQAIAQFEHQEFVPNQAGSISTDFQAINSEDQAKLVLQASFSDLGASASTFFSEASDNTKSRYAYIFQQTLLTASFVPDNHELGAASFFSPDTTVDSASPYLTADNPPLYINSVGYGRALYVLIACDASDKDVSAGLNASFSALASGASISVSTEQKNAASTCSAKTMVIGGQYSDVVPVLNNFSTGPGFFSSLMSYLQPNVSPIPGATTQIYAQPLWYKLNYVSTDSEAVIGATVHYDPSSANPVSYTRAELKATICDNDKEKDTPVSVAIVGSDGTQYEPMTVVQPGSWCGDNNCNGHDYYWGTHGQTYSTGVFSLQTPMPSYEVNGSFFQVQGPGDSWEASFDLYGVKPDNTEVRIGHSDCEDFNEKNYGSTTGQLPLQGS